jgi:2-oxoglutarate ferredoxin oxidoreductase subunit alpha
MVRYDYAVCAMLNCEGGVDPGKLPSLLHYDGTPITARFIAREIAKRMTAVQADASQSEAAE